MAAKGEFDFFHGFVGGALVGIFVSLVLYGLIHVDAGRRIKRLEDTVFPPAVEQTVGTESEADQP